MIAGKTFQNIQREMILKDDNPLNTIRDDCLQFAFQIGILKQIEQHAVIVLNGEAFDSLNELIIKGRRDLRQKDGDQLTFFRGH